MNYLYVIILLILYYALFANVNNYAFLVLETTGKINAAIKIRKIRYFTNIVLLPVITISSIRYSRKIRKVYEKIDSVDKNIKFLNTEIDHALCLKKDVIQITNVTFVVILFNLLDYYGFVVNNESYMYVLMWILDRIPDFIGTIVICSFAVLINKIKCRFKKINAILNIITKGESFISISESSDMNNCKFSMRKSIYELL